MTGSAAAAFSRVRGASGPTPTRLLIVDDSPIARAVLSRMLAPHPEFEVSAVAGSAEEAIAALAAAPVDVVLLDIEMPGASGLEVLPAILATGARVLVVSSACEEGAEAAVSAMALGAADTLAKPGAGAAAGRFSEELLDRLRRIGGPAANAAAAAPGYGSIRLRAAPAARLGCLALGASTGGLHAIAAFLRGLPPVIGAPIVVTQHLPPVFIPFFARQIESACGRRTLVAEEGRPLAAEEVVLAPGDAHLRLARRGGRVVVALDSAPAPSGCVPSVDSMLASVAETFGPAAIGVVLSGMGRDGLDGSRCIVERGGAVYVQDKESCAVWGMPRVVAEAGLASAVLPPSALALRIGGSLSGAPWR